MIEQRKEAVEGGLPQRCRSGPQLPVLKIPINRSSIGIEEAFQPSFLRGGAALVFLLRVLGRILTTATNNERGTTCARKGEAEDCQKAQGPILEPMSQGTSLLQLSRVTPHLYP